MGVRFQDGVLASGLSLSPHVRMYILYRNIYFLMPDAISSGEQGGREGWSEGGPRDRV